MKVYNPYLKGQTVKSSQGDIVIGEDGWAEVSDELGAKLVQSPDFSAKEVDAVITGGNVGRIPSIIKNSVLSASVVARHGITAKGDKLPDVKDVLSNVPIEPAKSPLAVGGAQGGEISSNAMMGQVETITPPAGAAAEGFPG